MANIGLQYIHAKYSYQFPLLLQSGRFWPGLGGSDSDYAWVLVSYNLFGMVSAPVAGTLLHRLPFTITIITFHVLLITGGIVYALAESVWVAFIGYGLTGAGVSFSSITIHTYLGQMGDVMDDIRKKQGKKPRKFLMYNIYSFIMTGGIILPFCKISYLFPSCSCISIVSLSSNKLGHGRD